MVENGSLKCKSALDMFCDGCEPGVCPRLLMKVHAQAWRAVTICDPAHNTDRSHVLKTTHPTTLARSLAAGAM